MSESTAEVKERVPGEPPKMPKSDLGVRTVSAVVMILVAGAALLLGSTPLFLLLALVALGLATEVWNLVAKLNTGSLLRAGIFLTLIVYIAVACWGLISLRSQWMGAALVAIVCGTVIATDVGAYFSGRSIGGPKIAPKISPNKTWAGLFGGMVAAALFHLGGNYLLLAVHNALDLMEGQITRLLAVGAFVAVLAQTGDFLESWLKRKAGVKDSGKLIPGHGGLFDRLDGYLPVFAVTGVANLHTLVERLPI